MRVLLHTAYFSYRALFRWLRPSSYLALKVLAPLAQVTFFALIGLFGGTHPPQFYLVGNAMAIATVSGVYSVATSVTDERREGTLLYLLATPANRVALFLGRAMLHIADGALGILFAFMWIAVVFGLNAPHANWIGVAAAIVVGTGASAGLGLLIGALAFRVFDASFLANIASFSILLLSGANLALTELPGWARAVAEGLPLTRSVAAARLFIAGESGGFELLAGDVLVGLAYSGAAYLMFRWTERLARASGSNALG